ncbi:MAG: type II toxin-antitoxin system VapC family toxin [Dyadobacter sp.]|uniref:type II toxin-antitoxin system VapC family toxin n=1 Tax=Dyadobacter sp. TaxID=1914288 RepID=UPI003266F94D
MKYLLDTHALIWALTETGKLSKTVKNILVKSDDQVIVSTISFWEISLKYSLGKLDLGGLLPDQFPDACLDTGFEILNLEMDTSSTYHQLKAHHKDPFDRMLIWQAISNRYTLISDDDNIKNYTSEGLKVVW